LIHWREGKAGSVLVPAGIHPYEALREMVAAHAHRDAIVLEVGAGDGDRNYPSWLEGIDARVVGIDPSARIRANQRLDERHRATLEEFAPDHPQHFDLAVASFVVEHVAAPDAFLAALHRCLKPGGSAFILTPHVLHYFGGAALIARRLRVDEWLLHWLRDEATLRDHHCPLEYRMNTRHQLTWLARRAGFGHIEFRMLDEPGLYEPYFPRPLRSLPVAWSTIVHRLHTPALAGTILARLEASPPG
jgi:SAM-dependent methyltransferase